MPDHTKDLICCLLEYGLATLICGTGLLLIVGNYHWKKRWKWDEQVGAAPDSDVV